MRRIHCPVARCQRPSGNGTAEKWDELATVAHSVDPIAALDGTGQDIRGAHLSGGRIDAAANRAREALALTRRLGARGNEAHALCRPAPKWWLYSWTRGCLSGALPGGATPHISTSGGHSPPQCGESVSRIPLLPSFLFRAAGYRGSDLVRCRVDPGSFTPSLSQSDLNLSIYPARATARRLPPSV